jgi:hypothetical protein
MSLDTVLAKLLEDAVFEKLNTYLGDACIYS